MREPLDPLLVPATAGTPSSVERVALVSVHTCPLDQPGTGDSGGMNVYVRQVARRLAEMGVQVDVFSRWAGTSKRIRTVHPGVRVIHLEAGPARPVPKEELSRYLCEFLYALLRFEASESQRVGRDAPFYDVVHSHYWLSGWVGRLAAERWDVPLVHSFHTLGLVKNRTLAAGDAPEPASRIAAEQRVVATADCILAPTHDEAADLVQLYDASPDRVRVVAPGVDTDLFKPGDRAAARAALGLPEQPILLFVGRLQPLKAPDLAVRALAELAARSPDLAPVLLLVGGPSGRGGFDRADLERLASTLGVAPRVEVRPPVPHASLARYYRAADVVLVPSRSESFGLVALEAAASGVPVVATDVGGLRTTVRHGSTGLLVPGPDASRFADALAPLLRDGSMRAAMGAAGACFARRFDWRVAATGLVAVYEQQVAARSSA